MMDTRGSSMWSDAFEAYRRSCWLQYYQHMASLQTPGQSAPQQQQQSKKRPAAIPSVDEDEDDDINKELLGL